MAPKYQIAHWDASETLPAASSVPEGLVIHHGSVFKQSVSGAWVTVAAGPQGDPGDSGNTILSGTSTPSTGTGMEGDYYLKTDTHVLYGPKTSGSWGSGVSLVGPAGSSGTAGAALLSGTSTPATLLGSDGDYYFKTSAPVTFYGPKASGAWPAGVVLSNYSGSGSPEGVVTAPVGSLYTNTAGGTSTTLYVKTSGTGNTGWTAK